MLATAQVMEQAREIDIAGMQITHRENVVPDGNGKR
jgi:hypothetical protein